MKTLSPFLLFFLLFSTQSFSQEPLNKGSISKTYKDIKQEISSKKKVGIESLTLESSDKFLSDKKLEYVLKKVNQAIKNDNFGKEEKDKEPLKDINWLKKELKILTIEEQEQIYSYLKNNVFCQTPDCNDTLVTAQTFKQIILDDFTYISTGLPQNSLRNQAVVGFNKENTEVDLNVLIRSNNKKDSIPLIVGAIGVKAGIDNGVAALITNDKLNTNVGVSIKGHLDLQKAFGLKYGYDYSEEFKKAFLIKRDIINKQLEIEKKELQFKIDKLNEKRIKARVLLNGTITQTQKDSIEISILKINLQIDTLTNLKKDFAKKVKKQVLEFEKTAEWEKRGFTWLTGLLEWNAQELRIIDTSKIFKGGAVTKQTFDGLKYGVFLNRYNFDNFRKGPASYFFSIGWSHNSAFNISGLKKFELQEKQDFSAVGGQQTKIELKDKTNTLTNASTNQSTLTRKYDVYQGDAPSMKENQWSIQYIPFLDKDKNFALDFRYDFIKRKISSMKKNYENLRIGLFFVAQNKEKDKGKVNIEVFADFNDLANTDSDKVRKFWYQRYSVGLQIGLPIGVFKNEK